MNISKSYGEKVILDSYSLEMAGGTCTCLMAASGQGKTTLLRILCGLEEPDSGTIAMPEGTRFSVVFQEDRLCANLSPIANIRMVAPGVKREEILVALEELGLSGCDQQPVRELSGGMKRRIALLRALFADYDVLLLDEPFSGLDTATRDMVIAYLRKKTQGKTVIVITHDPEDSQRLSAATRYLP